MPACEERCLHRYDPGIDQLANESRRGCVERPTRFAPSVHDTTAGWGGGRMPLTLRYVARSDVGLVREGNEDAGYAGPYILAVADGMGGHAAGEVASQAAVDELVQADLPPDGRVTLDTQAEEVNAANDRIRQLVDRDKKLLGMRTTGTLLLWTKSSFGSAHISESRAYR